MIRAQRHADRDDPFGLANMRVEVMTARPGRRWRLSTAQPVELVGRRGERIAAREQPPAGDRIGRPTRIRASRRDVPVAVEERVPFRGCGTSIVYRAAPIEPVSTFGGAGVEDEAFCVLLFEHATSSTRVTTGRGTCASDVGSRAGPSTATHAH